MADKRPPKGLQVRIQLVRQGSSSYSTKIAGPGDAAQLLAYLKREDREHFVCICVDANNNVLGVETVSIGTLSASLVHPRECLKAAILLNAAGVLIGHNHPSNSLEPSQEDIQTTRRLVKAGELMGIPVLDHIIVGDGGYTSMREKGLL